MTPRRVSGPFGEEGADMAELRRSTWQPIGFGFAAGMGIAAVDNLLFEGEVSPIVTLGLLLTTAITAGTVWGRRGWSAAVLAWAWVPGAHVVKRAAGSPDTLHPNTWASVLMLAAFTLAVAAVGLGCGLLVNRLAGRAAKPAGPAAAADRVGP